MYEYWYYYDLRCVNNEKCFIVIYWDLLCFDCYIVDKCNWRISGLK